MRTPFAPLVSLRRTFTSQKPEQPRFWASIPRWRDVSSQDFLTHRFHVFLPRPHRPFEFQAPAYKLYQLRNTIQSKDDLTTFLDEVLPTRVSKAVISDVLDGIDKAPMATRLTPYILSRINWEDPLQDPIFRQFLPSRSTFKQDHPRLELDSLGENSDSPCDGLVHRYPEKVLFLTTSVCPVYCRFCTRSYTIGGSTSTVSKIDIKPKATRLELMFDYIQRTTAISDVVVSGGDIYTLAPQQLEMIGTRLLSIPHIKRIRFASKGLAISPSRLVNEDDDWTNQLIKLSLQAREQLKSVALHTHFNHPNEISWITEAAAQRLYRNHVTVRNQTVLLRGVNDNFDTMYKLIHLLANNNIIPYYVYQGDMVKGVEDLRTPLYTILDLEKRIRGTIAGFMTPSFVVDLPGGGGKRLVSSFESYDLCSGVSTWTAPALQGLGKANRVYKYYDPK